MINVTLTNQSFEVSGHAMYADFGKDIVCSAVTTATFTTLGLLNKILNENQYQYVEKEGYIKFSTLEDLMNKVIGNLRFN
mgnify:CR=1 FL=1